MADRDANPAPDPYAEPAAVEAVRAGDLTALRSLLAHHPELARAGLRTVGGRTLLHVATDWAASSDDLEALDAPWTVAPTSTSGAQRDTAAYLLERGADVNW